MQVSTAAVLVTGQHRVTGTVGTEAGAVPVHRDPQPEVPWLLTGAHAVLGSSCCSDEMTCTGDCK